MVCNKMNSLLRVIENDSQNICREIQRVSASLTTRPLRYTTRTVHYRLTTAERDAILYLSS